MSYRFIYILLILNISVFSQNLVPNSSFEKPISKNFNNNEGFWNKCLSSDTPDYFTDSVSNKIFDKYYGGIKAHSGNSFIGLFIYRKRINKNGEIREFVQSPLLKTLKRDTVYYVEAYISIDYESNVISDGFGIFFSDTSLSPEKSQDLYLHHPQISNPLNHYIEKSDDWIKFSGTFKANGNEKYIVIGNFKPDVLTNIRTSKPDYISSKKRKWYLKENENIAYLYIDDVKVIYCDSLNKEDTICKLNQKQAKIKLENRLSAELNPRVIYDKFQTDSIILSNKTNDLKSDSIFNSKTAIIAKGQVYNLKRIFFEFNKAVFKEDAIFELNELLKFMRNNKSIEIEIRGYTDNIGSVQYNIDLSISRAKAIENFLINNGINKNRIQSYGYGSTKPIDNNETEEGRANNRRIEILITKE